MAGAVAKGENIEGGSATVTRQRKRSNIRRIVSYLTPLFAAINSGGIEIIEMAAWREQRKRGMASAADNRRRGSVAWRRRHQWYVVA